MCARQCEVHFDDKTDQSHTCHKLHFGSPQHSLLKDHQHHQLLAIFRVYGTYEKALSFDNSQALFVGVHVGSRSVHAKNNILFRLETSRAQRQANTLQYKQ